MFTYSESVTVVEQKLANSIELYKNHLFSLSFGAYVRRSSSELLASSALQPSLIFGYRTVELYFYPPVRSVSSSKLLFSCEKKSAIPLFRWLHPTISPFPPPQGPSTAHPWTATPRSRLEGLFPVQSTQWIPTPASVPLT
jgi:hypothetical protein